MPLAYGLENGAYSALVTPPAVPLVSTADAKAWLRQTSSAEDDLIASLAAAAGEYLDAKGGILGRALITQTWRLNLSAFPAGNAISLPITPVQSVSGITYYDATNSQQSFSDFRLVATEFEAVVELDAGASWPSAYNRIDAVSIEYVAGYGSASSDVPDPIVTAAKLMLAQWYEHREASAEKVFSQLPMGAQQLLMNYRPARGLM